MLPAQWQHQVNLCSYRWWSCLACFFLCAHLHVWYDYLQDFPNVFPPQPRSPRVPCPLCTSSHWHKLKVVFEQHIVPHISSLCSLKYGLNEVLSGQSHAWSVTKWRQTRTAKWACELSCLIFQNFLYSTVATLQICSLECNILGTCAYRWVSFCCAQTLSHLGKDIETLFISWHFELQLPFKTEGAFISEISSEAWFLTAVMLFITTYFNEENKARQEQDLGVYPGGATCVLVDASFVRLHCFLCLHSQLRVSCSVSWLSLTHFQCGNTTQYVLFYTVFPCTTVLQLLQVISFGAIPEFQQHSN